MERETSLKNPFKVAIIIGVPGVGKSTVLSHLAKLAEERGVKLKIVNFGDYMVSKAIEKGFVNNRDELRRLSFRQQLELQAIAAQEIINDAKKELDEKSVLLIDTHALVRTPKGYLPGLPQHILDKLKPDVIIVVEASPEEILARQQRDKSRFRADMGTAEDIRRLMEYARMSAFSSATISASLITIVYNKEGYPEEAARAILEVIEGL